MSDAATKLAALEAAIREKAGEEASTDDEGFDPHDYWGGHAHDTFDAGVRNGEIQYARELLTLIEAPQ